MLIRVQGRSPIPVILSGSAPYPLALPSYLQKHGTDVFTLALVARWPLSVTQSSTGLVVD